MPKLEKDLAQVFKNDIEHYFPTRRKVGNIMLQLLMTKRLLWAHADVSDQSKLTTAAEQNHCIQNILMIAYQRKNFIANRICKTSLITNPKHYLKPNSCVELLWSTGITLKTKLYSCNKIKKYIRLPRRHHQYHLKLCQVNYILW